MKELSAPSKSHLLTVLVEDYFHVGAFEKLIQKQNWSNFETRYEQNTLKALDLLDEFGTKATFFVLGWIAQESPKLIKEIVGRGHEIASRGFYHRSINSLTPAEFKDDLARTRRLLEDASGHKVVGYRSPEKLRFHNDEWVFDILAEEGYVYDASFLPTRSLPVESRAAALIKTASSPIWEFPYSTIDLKLGLLPISGGNYLRQIPYTLMRHAVASWDRNIKQPLMFYFHVWELDPEQPRITAASRYNRIRHYRKLDKMSWIVRENLARYPFTSISDHLDLEMEVTSPLLSEASLATVQKAISPQQEDVPKIPVSIILPCYNEEDALPYLAKTLLKVEKKLFDSGYAAEFIFVDDHSTDGTASALEKLANNSTNIRIVRHQRNQGVAAAIRTGLIAAKTELVCSMDCDCTYDPLELATMLPLLDDNTDMVTASPYHRDGNVRNVPGWRLFLSKGASFLYRRTLNTKLATYTSCFRVYRRSSMLDLNIAEGGFLGIAEMLGKLDQNGGAIKEFPAVLEVRLFGASKMKTAKTIFGHLKLLWKLNTSKIKGKYVGIGHSSTEESVQIGTETTFRK